MPILDGIDDVIGKNPCYRNGDNAEQQEAGQDDNGTREQARPKAVIIHIEPPEHRLQGEPEANAQNEDADDGEKDYLDQDSKDTPVGQALERKHQRLDHIAILKRLPEMSNPTRGALALCRIFHD